MKALMALVMAVLVLGMTVASVTAPNVGTQKALNARIHRMGAMGNGLAISQSDPMDFELLKIGIAGIKVGLADETAEVKVGVLYFGENKYMLKNVVLGNGSVSADVYDGETHVGTISLDSYPKGNTEIWAGDLTLNDVTYNAYVIQVARKVKAVEKAGKAVEYCENNPELCKAAMKAVGQIMCDPVTDENCRNRIQSFCESNPEDNRCKRLEFEYCKRNFDDADCRAQLMEKCKANLNEDFCERLGGIYDKFVEKRPAAANSSPAWLVSIRNRIQSRLTAANAGDTDTGDDDTGDNDDSGNGNDTQNQTGNNTNGGA